MEGNAATASAWYSVGAQKLVHGDIEGAIRAYGQSLRLEPRNPAALNNLGAALIRAGRFDEATATLQKALILQPGYTRALVNLGKALRESGHIAEAVARLRTALAAEPKNGPTLINLGEALAASGELDESQAVLERAISLYPASVEAHMTLGIVQLQAARTASALGTLRTAVALSPEHPDAHANLGHALFVDGHWQEAWPHFEYRFQRHAHRRKWSPPAGFTRWNGVPDPQRELWLIGEQGLGDQIQFARYAKVIEAVGMRCVLACHPAIVRLLSQEALASRVVALDRLSTGADPVLWTPLLSLPGWHQTNMHSVPYADGYLTPEPERMRAWSARLSGLPGMRVGICWAGNPNMETGRHAGRSPQLPALAPLMELPDINFISLQKHIGEEQLDSVIFGRRIERLAGLDATADAFVDTAAVLDCLHLVITSDTAIAHLAGALGVPTWLCLAHQPDWRWMDQGETTPWYSSLRLFRQSTAGNWRGVYEEVATELDSRRRRLSNSRNG